MARAAVGAAAVLCALVVAPCYGLGVPDQVAPWGVLNSQFAPYSSAAAKKVEICVRYYGPVFDSASVTEAPQPATADDSYQTADMKPVKFEAGGPKACPFDLKTKEESASTKYPYELIGEPCIYHTDCIRRAKCVRRDSNIRFKAPSPLEIAVLTQGQITHMAVLNHCVCETGYFGHHCDKSVVTAKQGFVYAISTGVMSLMGYMRLMAFQVRIRGDYLDESSTKGVLTQLFAADFSMASWQPWSEERVLLDACNMISMICVLLGKISLQTLDVAVGMMAWVFGIFVTRLHRFMRGPTLHSNQCGFDEPMVLYDIKAECPLNKELVSETVEVHRERPLGQDEEIFHFSFNCNDVSFQVKMKQSYTLKAGDTFWEAPAAGKEDENGLVKGVRGVTSVFFYIFKGIYMFLFQVPYALAYDSKPEDAPVSIIFTSCGEFVSTNTSILHSGKMVARGDHMPPPKPMTGGQHASKIHKTMALIEGQNKGGMNLQELYAQLKAEEAKEVKDDAKIQNLKNDINKFPTA